MTVAFSLPKSAGELLVAVLSVYLFCVFLRQALKPERREHVLWFVLAFVVVPLGAA